jgi:hypothetical protein
VTAAAAHNGRDPPKEEHPVSAASTLLGRLLSASRLAYQIEREGALPPGGHADAAGLEGSVVAAVAGFEGMDACLVGSGVDGVVVAFRGTLPPHSPNQQETVSDWLNDLEAMLVPASWPVDGLVHAGFRGSLDRLWPGLSAAVQAQRAKTPGRTVYVTGHSKGGALAHLGAHRLAVELGLAPREIAACTFAAPHPGNASFAQAYAAAVGSITRYEYADDVVPSLPPTLALRQAFKDVPLFAGLRLDLDYAAVGELRFIDWDGHVVGDSPVVRARRTFQLISLLVEGRFDRIVADHSIADGSGYGVAAGFPAV